MDKILEYAEIVEKMEEQGIEFLPGLKIEQIALIEHTFGVNFPAELRLFYETALPVSKKFYDWTDLSEENQNKIRKQLSFPVRSVSKALNIDLPWPASWGEKPEDEDDVEEKAAKILSEATALIPLYGHRYLACVEGEACPVLSIYGGDIIYYGNSLSNWLQVEFLGQSRKTIFETEPARVPGWDVLIS